ncbi:hypothetical protein B0T19DRAFT_40459 [Cercophora scortea]|uniref:DH domain-containing protein n=1 Tax=Cercophora scortea TaxID=314031 RepID=A0AAE0ML48_9PEZI|nr:hypothetical protein B0T19DRAFT_40459 [Cercophora scortea]
MALIDTETISPCSVAPSISIQSHQESSPDAGSPVLLYEHGIRYIDCGGADFELNPASNTDEREHKHELPMGNDEIRDWGSLDTISAVGFEDAVAHKQGLENREYFEAATPKDKDCDTSLPASSKPFYKWIRTLHKRAVRRRAGLDCEGDPAPYSLDMDGESSLIWGSAHHRQSSSGSSFGFVTAVKSASISLTSASVLTRSRKNTIRSSRGHSRTDRSSRASVSGARLSEDSFCPERQMLMDPVVMERSLQRRRILEELISTEESYIGDVRFLMNVYVTILASLPTLPAGLRSSINRNLTDIVELHEEMLGDLHRAVPHSEYTQLELPRPMAPPGAAVRGHHRWRSLDAVPEDKDGISWLRDCPGMLADPQTVAEVAKIFSKKMNRFFIYEEYGAKYELMIKDVASAQRTMPRWQSCQKGLEVLAASLGSVNSQSDRSRKSLTIGDLLVKPIQRVCKYPLLFAELLKYTPVVDCPYSHMEIENTLIRLREATGEINRATDDARIKSILEKTWILQDRLVFPNQQLDAASKNRIRSFGHIQLCGALHVCWQTKEGVNGQYMVALLYKEWICLATASRIDQIYTIQACIALSNVKVEEVDNGRGLQCHTAPYSWKIVFICDHQLYEMILTACTPKEELEWRTRLGNQNLADNQDQTQPVIFSSLSLNIKTLGTVFRKPGTIARRISIHRATTVGPKSPLCQVILKNTSVIKDAPSSGAGSQINRSQSLLTTNSRIPVLAPSRGERARLEALLSDVWTRDILPFPGITARSRSEHLVRSSASSVMRKLSVVSIAGTFTKRSTSLASLQPQQQQRNPKGGAEDEGFYVSRRAKDAVTTAVIKSCSDSEDTSRSLLSVIPDEAERCSPLPPCAVNNAEWHADLFRMVHHRLDRVWAASEGDAEKMGLYAEGLRESSANSSASRPPSSQHSNLDNMCTKDSNKENGFLPPSPPQELCRVASHSHKLSSRWLHREVVVQSIRNMFR